MAASRTARPAILGGVRFAFLIRIADVFLSRSQRSTRDAGLLRARVTVLTCLIGSVGVLAAILAEDQAPSPGIRAGSYSLSGAFFLVPVAMRLGLPARVAQQLLLGLIWLYASLLAFVTGGKDTGAVLVALLVPFFGILFSGLWLGLAWSGWMALSLISAFVAIESGYRAPVEPDFDAVARFNLLGTIVAIFATLGLAASYEWLRANAAWRLSQERKRVDQLHAEQRDADRRFQAELEAVIGERTRELEQSHRELRRAERLASIGTLAAGVAHEINNPVGAILISAQYALDGEPESPREATLHAALRECEAQAQRCARIVRGLLRFAVGTSAAKSGQDLNAIVSDALTGLRAGLSGGDVERVETRFASGPLRIEADPVGLEQVVVNLVRNALDASAQGGRPVRVATASVDQGVVLRVEDEGPGIPVADLPRIFDPFFSTRMRAGGTGLGLSIVHGIVLEHGGSIEVESEPGKGACFLVRLPAEPARAPAP